MLQVRAICSAHSICIRSHRLAQILLTRVHVRLAVVLGAFEISCKAWLAGCGFLPFGQICSASELLLWGPEAHGLGMDNIGSFAAARRSAPS
jgi:hypothetical protein